MTAAFRQLSASAAPAFLLCAGIGVGSLIGGSQKSVQAQGTVDAQVAALESRITVLEAKLARFSVSPDGNDLYLTGANLHITAPWPKDLTVAVKYLRRYAVGVRTSARLSV